MGQQLSSQDAHSLPSITIKDGNSEKVIYTLPVSPGPENNSVLYFTIPKSGTIMLTNLLGSLTHAAKLSIVYVIGELYQAGALRIDSFSTLMDNAPASTSEVILPKGYCYGFPGVPTTFEIPIFGTAKSIMMVRDPRDMAVSKYFSILLSHPKPGPSAGQNEMETRMPLRAEARDMGLDRFAITYCASYYRDILKDYRELALSPSMKVFRYEDVVYEKKAWAQEICSHYGWNVSDEQLEAAVAKVDVFPDKERPDQHVRQVHPGNYKQKLRPETIRYIEETCAEEMEFFGYAPDNSK